MALRDLLAAFAGGAEGYTRGTEIKRQRERQDRLDPLQEALLQHQVDQAGSPFTVSVGGVTGRAGSVDEAQQMRNLLAPEPGPEPGPEFGFGPNGPSATGFRDPQQFFETWQQFQGMMPQEGDEIEVHGRTFPNTPEGHEQALAWRRQFTESGRAPEQPPGPAQEQVAATAQQILSQHRDESGQFDWGAALNAARTYPGNQQMRTEIENQLLDYRTRLGSEELGITGPRRDEEGNPFLANFPGLSNNAGTRPSAGFDPSPAPSGGQRGLTPPPQAQDGPQVTGLVQGVANESGTSQDRIDDRIRELVKEGRSDEEIEEILRREGLTS